MKQEKAKISPFDHGFLYGIGIFETFRMYNGHPFLLDDHLERLHQGLQELNIKYSLKREDVLSILTKLKTHNELPNAYVRLNVSAGIGEIGLRSEPYPEPTIIVFQKKLPSVSGLSSKEGRFLSIRRNTPETGFRLKSHHYLNNMAAKREIGSTASIEGIFLTEQGYVAEGITSNIFWYKNHTLYTPKIETGILNGITRQFVLSLSDQLGVKTNEGCYSKEHLLSAEEIFFTNSVQGVVPISQLDAQVFPGCEGELVKMLSTAYQEKTGDLWSHHELGGRS